MMMMMMIGEPLLLVFILATISILAWYLFDYLGSCCQIKLYYCNAVAMLQPVIVITRIVTCFSSGIPSLTFTKAESQMLVSWWNGKLANAPPQIPTNYFRKQTAWNLNMSDGMDIWKSSWIPSIVEVPAAVLGESSAICTVVQICCNNF